MLRRIIKAIIPSKGDIFFDLFIEMAGCAHETAKTFVEVINAETTEKGVQYSSNLRILKQKCTDINKKILLQLNNMFITPLERGDIQELSGLLFKLTKRIVKISSKLKLYSIDTKADDVMIRNANTLLIITKVIVEMVTALKNDDPEKISACNEKANELEENGIEDLRHAINEMYSGNYDTLTILKLKEIYKSVDSAIETCVALSDLVLQISVKDI